MTIARGPGTIVGQAVAICPRSDESSHRLYFPDWRCRVELVQSALSDVDHLPKSWVPGPSRCAFSPIAEWPTKAQFHDVRRPVPGPEFNPGRSSPAAAAGLALRDVLATRGRVAGGDSSRFVESDALRRWCAKKVRARFAMVVACAAARARVQVWVCRPEAGRPAWATGQVDHAWNNMFGAGWAAGCRRLVAGRVVGCGWTVGGHQDAGVVHAVFVCWWTASTSGLGRAARGLAKTWVGSLPSRPAMVGDGRPETAPASIAIEGSRGSMRYSP